MSIRPIVYLNDPRLREKALPVTRFDQALQKTIDDMFDTMYANRGIGLANPQMDEDQSARNELNLQIAVIDVTSDRSTIWCLINPEITWREGEALLEEACLSIPGARGYDIPRALRVGLKALDRHGKPYEIEADGLLAHCIQHELDHLEGKLFIDYLSPLKKQRAIQQFEKTYKTLMREKNQK